MGFNPDICAKMDAFVFCKELHKELLERRLSLGGSIQVSNVGTISIVIPPEILISGGVIQIECLSEEVNDPIIYGGFRRGFTAEKGTFLHQIVSGRFRLSYGDQLPVRKRFSTHKTDAAQKRGRKHLTKRHKGVPHCFGSSGAHCFACLSYQIARDQQILPINRERLREHADHTAETFFQCGLFDYTEFLNFLFVGVCTLLDFQWMNLPVFLHEYVDLLCVRIPIEGQQRSIAGIGVIFDQLHDHIVFI